MHAGRYRLTRRIAQGGMAEIYEALAVGEGAFERRVAIKRLLPAHVSDAGFVRMFLDEVRIVSKLHHGNIVAIFDYGVADDLPFAVLEYVDGSDAARLARLGRENGRPLPVELALHIVGEVAHALEYAHRARDDEGVELGIVHRDVTPRNVLVSWQGDVKLADFGIARARNRLEETSTGVTKGTVAYMSPEQATGGSTDHRADIFALGCVLHALLTGESPVTRAGGLADLFAGHALSLEPSLPEDVRRIIGKAVQLEVEPRYASAAEMALDIGRALAPRLSRDPRSRLCEWLGALSDRKPARKPGRLDAFVGLELKLVSDATGIRCFQTSPSTPSIPADSTRAKTVQDEPRSRRRGSARRALIVGSILGVGVVAAGVAGSRWLFSQSGAAETGRTQPTPGPGKGRSSPIVASPELTADSPPPPAASEVVDPGRRPTTADRGTPSPAPADGRPGALRKSGRAQPVQTATPGDGPPSEPAQPSVAHGWIRVGGTGALRAEIWVDGRSHGFAPRLVQVATGEHHLELIGPEGGVIAERRIDVAAQHTHALPAGWIVP